MGWVGLKQWTGREPLIQRTFYRSDRERAWIRVSELDMSERRSLCRRPKRLCGDQGIRARISRHNLWIALFSLFAKYKDCSWYRRCPSLSRQPAGFRTLRVRNGTNAISILVAKRRAEEEARDELQKAFSTAPAAKWLTPHAAVKIAFCFFGKIGTLHDPSSYTAADSGDAATVRLAHAAFERYVLAASPNAAAKVFVHSGTRHWAH